MRNRFRKVKELASESKHRSGRTYYLIGKFDKFNGSLRRPYQIFKANTSSWTKIEELDLRR